MDHRSLLTFTTILVLVLQFQLHLLAGPHGADPLAARSWHHAQRQAELRRLGIDLASQAPFRRDQTMAVDVNGTPGSRLSLASIR